KLENITLTSENKFAPAPECEPDPKIKIFKKATAQTHLALGFYGLKRDHRDKHIYSLLHIILGGNMSSRLFSEVREKRGLAYEIGTRVKGFTDTGLFLIHAGVDNAKLYQAADVIINELGKIKTRLVLSSELRRAKEFYIGQLRLALEETLEHMFWIGEPTLHLDKTYSFSSILKEIKAITPGDLRRVARQVFHKRAARMAIIGPSKEEAKLYASIRKL
ncbi:M16 family metallopeptidase, partial [Candidatus Omnitrophota bacterium]